jgi:hypothetical protein
MSTALAPGSSVLLGSNAAAIRSSAPSPRSRGQLV